MDTFDLYPIKRVQKTTLHKKITNWLGILSILFLCLGAVIFIIGFMLHQFDNESSLAIGKIAVASFSFSGILAMIMILVIIIGD